MLRKLRGSAPGHLVVTLFGVGCELLHFPLAMFRSRAALTAENLFLRKQLAFYQERQVEPRRLSDAARICLVLCSRLFNWREAIIVVKPDTLIRWHRRAFCLLWRWKSRGGRPRLPKNIRQLIAEMARENPTRGQVQVAEELTLKLGVYVSPRTVRAYWPRTPLRSGPQAADAQHWRTFIRNHAKSVLACDFFVSVSARFQLLYVLVVMETAPAGFCTAM
jgi:putative transposase